MCGGVGYKYKNIKESDLKKFYSSELLKKFKSEGRVESFFWHEKASLPVKGHEGIQLKLWGNKEKDLKLPKTGWARVESLKEGKWDYLEPEEVEIMVDDGCEKKHWFQFINGTRGILVKKDGEERVYMMTREASEDYRRVTGHDREPLGEKSLE